MKTTRTLVKVNVLAEEITMTKATAKRASDIGSAEYEQLLKAKKDFPDFTVRISSPKAKENKDKGLTIELMKRIIEVMEDDSKTALEEFKKAQARCKGTNYHFSDVKGYFLSKYPDWRGCLREVEKRQEEQAEQKKQVQVQDESSAAVEDKPKEDSIKRFNMFGR